MLIKVKECKWVAIIGDETRDLINSEQLSISIRWVSSNFEIHEDPIGMIQVPKTDAETISMAIKLDVQYHLVSVEDRHTMGHQIRLVLTVE